MILIDPWIESEFQFLTSKEGFVLESRCTNDFKFVKNDIVLTLSYNNCDGFDAILVSQKSNDISLNTVLDAIKTHEGSFSNSENDTTDDPALVKEQIVELARFLFGNGKKILQGNLQLINELGKIRFWHVGHWISQWGYGIEMSNAKIEENKMLVPKIIQLLK